MTEPLWPQPMDLHEAFTWTVHGEKLRGEVRFAKYKPDSLSNDDWEALLGPDVNNLGHLEDTYRLARAGLARLRQTQPGFYTPAEEHLIEIASITHDWPEALVGDISYGDKTPEQLDREYGVFVMMIGHLCGHASSKVFEACTQVVFNSDTKTGQGFEAVERVGYTRTALRAQRHLAENTAPAVAVPGMRWLVADVLARQVPALVEASETFVPVADYLKWQRSTITQGFEYLLKVPDVFVNYGDRQGRMRSMFNDSFAAWRGWLKATEALPKSA
ncbi:MAG: hypothetical protein WBP26_03545 [Candidatus Saccharimonadales bacterium]